jgi:hypothetical protein
LNVFCKVRGEKVIRGFFNNEPRYLLPILNELETGRNYATDNDGEQAGPVVPWVERFVLLSWLSHLMLAPFPLESISAPQPSEETAELLHLSLPPQVPGVTLRVLTVCIERLQSASKERGAAANLLVKLCGRPDMQRLGLLDTLLGWSASFFDKGTAAEVEIHQSLGILSFLSGLVASATNVEIGRCLSAVYGVCRSILDQKNLQSIRSSAVARKLIVKILRNIVVHCLQPDAGLVDLDATSVLEEVIEYLLEAVADGDTPVRYGASKALSIITLKLDPEMAAEVVEAILGSLNESVYWQGSKRNLSGVNPLRWHGLTLTLAQLLYRKAISTNNLPDVLNALLLSLSFEQRSPTGGSIGTNVRDAACFGVWALSRRYATGDLLKVETASIRACENSKTLSVPQALAIELVTVACLDPAGNIRRGSSAALQELIGRHPNTIEQGIPLVQVVDFHAVGLRQRAMCDVAIRAGGLHPLYWEALFDSLLGWRGTGSLDTDSRLFAAKAVGIQSKDKQADVARRMSDEICKQLAALRSREVEERQGLVSALAALVDTANATTYPHDSDADAATQSSTQNLVHLWSLLNKELKLEDKAFTSPALRPELTASSLSYFIAAMATLTIQVSKSRRPKDLPMAQVTHILNLCLSRHEDSVLDALMATVPAVLALLSDGFDGLRDTLLGDWLSKLENETSYNGVRCSGHTVALGAAYSVINSSAAQDRVSNSTTDIQRRIIQVLTFRCTSAVAIEARTVALRSLTILIRNAPCLQSDVESHIATALHIALNDYTITERGDVGSLVRIEALKAVSAGWSTGTFRAESSEKHQQIHADILRLSLEKLDKIRAIATRVLRVRTAQALETDTSTEDESSQAYFSTALQAFQATSSDTLREAICLGYVNSAGMGTESVAQNARDALIEFVDMLPDESATTSNQLSLTDLVSCMLALLKSHIANDRALIPLLETIAFLFDMQVLQRLVPTPFKSVPLPIPNTISTQSKTNNTTQFPHPPLPHAKSALQIHAHAETAFLARRVSRAGQCSVHAGGYAGEGGEYAAASVSKGMCCVKS